MLLNAKEIKEKKLLRRTIDKNFLGASYNLSVGEIITMDGKRTKEYKLPPRGMVLIVSNELFNLPDNILGYTTVKNSLSANGMLAINIGIVDPEWNKPISSLIINFGNVDHLISEGETFLRMTFHEFNKYDKENLKDIENFSIESDSDDYDNYAKISRKQAVTNLSNTFLSISKIRDEVAKRVRLSFLKDILILGGSIGILGFLLTYSKDFLDYKKSQQQNYHFKQLDSLCNKIKYLESKIDSLNTKIIKNEQNTMGKASTSSLGSKRK